MEDEIKVGDYVRNKISGKFGRVAHISADYQKLTVLTFRRTHTPWHIKNVERIKDATK